MGREFRWNRGVIIMPKYKVTSYYENTKIFEAKDLEELEEVIEKKTVGATFTEIKEEREIKVIRRNSHA